MNTSMNTSLPFLSMLSKDEKASLVAHFRKEQADRQTQMKKYVRKYLSDSGKSIKRKYYPSIMAGDRIKLVKKACFAFFGIKETNRPIYSVFLKRNSKGKQVNPVKFYAAYWFLLMETSEEYD